MVGKETTLVEYLEEILLKAPLRSEANRKALGDVTVWQYHTYLAENGPRSVEKSRVPWDDTAWSLADTVGRSTSLVGKRFLKTYGPAPKPDCLQDRARRGSGGKELTEAEVATLSARIFGLDERTFTEAELLEFAQRLFGPGYRLTEMVGPPKGHQDAERIRQEIFEGGEVDLDEAARHLGVTLVEE